MDDAHQQVLKNLLRAEGHGPAEGWSVLPTPLRLNAHPGYTGKGVTICFIDSGFHLHPDLSFPDNRIKEVLDITYPDRSRDYFFQPHSHAWHGTMAAVVCAGNGFLSQGVYRGLASEAELVLLKVSSEDGRITEDNITKALHWVELNHRRYGIRIVNLSVAGDRAAPFHESEMAQTIKRLYDQGVTVVAAAGNDPQAPVLPPANAPDALAVGGLDDRNTLDPLQQSLYHSTYGWTIDGLLKPELLAPAIWLAAPILPGTPVQKQAQALFEELEAALGQERERLLKEVRQHKFIAPHYQHADGTSFAAPIVCSIIAQMLEAKPTLAPEMVREILLSTARPLPDTERERQGYGVVQAGPAVQQASGEPHSHLWPSMPLVDYSREEIQFRFHFHHARSVALAGDFNGWAPSSSPMEEVEAGIWQQRIPLPEPGVYRYKYIVDGRDWKSDPLNAYRAPDEFGDFNSLFFI